MYMQWNNKCLRTSQPWIFFTIGFSTCEPLAYVYDILEVVIGLSDKMAKGDRVRLRFSTKRVKKLCDKLQEDQKDFLRAHGFANFVNLSVFTVSIPLLDFL